MKKSLLPRRANSSSSSLAFQYMSDLHLEVGQHYSEFEIPVRAPFLILAGDIGRLCDYENFRSFLAIQCKKFEKVFLVLGNHEFYERSHSQGLKTVQRLIAEGEGLRNLILLHRTRIDISNSLTILGCTLWSAIIEASRQEVEARVSDFKKISGWTVDEHNRQHHDDLAWLKEQISTIAEQEPSRRILVVTHHAPLHRGTGRPEHENSSLSSAFCTDILEQAQTHAWQGWGLVQAWIFGHTHWCSRLSRGHMKLLSNQRGYVFPNAVPVPPVRTRFSLWRKRTPREFQVESVVSL